MPYKIAVSNLNASTIDILNVIRANASAEYQDRVPKITQADEVPKVGEAIFGYPGLANEFLGALMNRIALVRVKSATFYNDYAELKKGYLEFGETVEEVFVNIAKVKWYSSEKAAAREFARTLPDVKSQFHAINWRALYSVTIQNDELKKAFLSISGVEDLIARIVDSIYTADSYDEFLLFKYLMIKAIAHGKMKPIAVDTTNMDNAAIAFRGTSNMLQFMGSDYNAAGVKTTTPKSDQYIFMDATFNAKYDVEVLAAAFNMDKADFTGHLKLIDSFGTFDNDRWITIRAESDGVEEVTDEELALTKNVVAVLVDKEWFQIYDNQKQFTEKYVASGLYWNYFYHDWKIVDSSVFSNAIVFVNDSASITPPTEISATIQSIDTSDNYTVVNIVTDDATTLADTNGHFVQTFDAVQAGVAVHPYGSYIVPPAITDLTVVYDLNGVEYNAVITMATAKAGDTVTLTKG